MGSEGLETPEYMHPGNRSIKEEAIRAIVRSLQNAGYVAGVDTETPVKSFLEREELGATAIGKGVACPHGGHEAACWPPEEHGDENLGHPHSRGDIHRPESDHQGGRVPRAGEQRARRAGVSPRWTRRNYSMPYNGAKSFVRNWWDEAYSVPRAAIPVSIVWLAPSHCPARG